jgi:hypothetical protein
MIAVIYARLNTKAVDRALQTQADRLCSLVPEPVVLPALTQGIHMVLEASTGSTARPCERFDPNDPPCW